MSTILCILSKRPAVALLSSNKLAARSISTTPVNRLENLVPPETAYPESLRGQAFEPSGWRATSDRATAGFATASNFAQDAKDGGLADPAMEKEGSVWFVRGIGRETL